MKSVADSFETATGKIIFIQFLVILHYYSVFFNGSFIFFQFLFHLNDIRKMRSFREAAEKHRLSESVHIVFCCIPRERQIRRVPAFRPAETGDNSLNKLLFLTASDPF